MEESAPDLARVLAVYERYIEARNALLRELNLQSNRDPLSEFSEWLVAALVKGTLAGSRVQKGWDVRTPDGNRVQVKYLANPSDHWVNEHEIKFTDDMDNYAIVFFEALLPQAVIIFPAYDLMKVGHALGKRHPNLDKSLQFTRANYRQILSNPSLFTALGVRQFVAPEWQSRG